MRNLLVYPKLIKQNQEFPKMYYLKWENPDREYILYSLIQVSRDSILGPSTDVYVYFSHSLPG